MKIKTAHKIKTMTNIEAGDCRWPIGDPRHEGFHFCGAQQVLGRPYCAEHAAQSHEASKPRHSANSRPLPLFRAA